MQRKLWWLALGLSLVAAPGASAQVTGGVLSVTQSHMS
jgi:hypothetical protein